MVFFLCWRAAGCCVSVDVVPRVVFLLLYFLVLSFVGVLVSCAFWSVR